MYCIDNGYDAGYYGVANYETNLVETDSREVCPQRLLDTQFDFKYPTIDDTLKDVFC